MSILIQNTGATPFFMNLIDISNKTSGLAGRLTFEADNNITKISEEIYLKKIKDNPFFKDKIERGVLVVLNDVGIKPQAASEMAAATRELGYARYKSLMLEIEKSGGIKNAELKPYLDPHGAPVLNLVRANMGQVDPDKIAEYKARYLSEKAAGINLNLPRNKKLTSASSEVEEELKAMAEEKKDESPKEEVKSTNSDGDKWTKENLLALADLDKEELFKVADQLGIKYSKKIPNEKLVERILEEQEATKE